MFLAILTGCGTPCPSDKRVEDLSAARIKELNEKIAKLSPDAKTAFLKKLQVGSQFAPKQLFVKFKSETSEIKIRSVLGTLNSKVLYEFKSSGALLVDVPSALSDSELLAVAAAMSEVSSVEYAHPNSILRAINTPNDPQFGEQEDLNNTGVNGARADSDIDAPEAWQITTGSSSVVVGVIDTGIDYSHPDLQENMWTNPGESGLDAKGLDKRSNGVDDDQNGFVDDFRGWDFTNNDNDPMDDHGHGTHVAGTIGAVGNNGVGITGVNWRVSLVGLKFLSASGSGLLSDALRAIEYANMMNIPITNNSWGGGGFDPALEAAIRAGRDKGFLFVAAAGNNSSDNDVTPAYPGSYNLANILSVAAVDSSDQLARFSNFGVESVHVAAPGDNILSTLPGGQYGRLSGTSMAAPHVAGVAALIKAVFPDSNYIGLKSRVLGSSERFSQLTGKVVAGRLNAAQALENDTSAPSPINQPAIQMVGITRLDVQWAASGDDGSAGSATSYELRVSSKPIISDGDWAAAQPVRLSILSQAAQVRARVFGLPMRSKGFLSVRALDNVGNISSVGGTTPFELAPPVDLFSSDAESFKGLEVVGATVWSQEEVEKRGKVFSESPGAPYKNSIETAIVLPPIKVVYPDVFLSFATRISCESGFDWVFVEFTKNDEKAWREIASYSASSCNWANLSFQLGDKVSTNDVLRIRFRFKSDESNIDEGWLIDDIKVTSTCFTEAIGGVTTDVTDSDGTWRVHTFTSSGNFDVRNNCGGVDYLVVAGGGGGGAGRAAGGGGAGGVIQGKGLIPNLGITRIGIGSGGAPRINGGKSSFGSLEALGGGRGGDGELRGGNPVGVRGGSGGGGGFKNRAMAGSGTLGQGNSGGVSRTGNWLGGGGGGGAAGPGGPGGGSNRGSGGNGGAGITHKISGVQRVYASGGGGCGQHDRGLASIGGGVGGRDGVGGSAGLANTGSGGGGCGGVGGSGVVILRYKIR